MTQNISVAVFRAKMEQLIIFSQSLLSAMKQNVLVVYESFQKDWIVVGGYSDRVE